MSVIDHPTHYAEATHGIPGECITYTEHLGFVRGSAFKYAWRAGFKANTLEDIGKCLWYINRDITRGGDNLLEYPGHHTYLIANGPMTVRRRVLLDLWTRHDLTNTHALLTTTLNDPSLLDKEI